jgi:hypothetical protein
MIKFSALRLLKVKNLETNEIQLLLIVRENEQRLYNIITEVLGL